MVVDSALVWVTVSSSAATAWADALAAWAVPDEILAAAPESPWGFPARLFAAATPDDDAGTPSRTAALEGLSAGSSVLDVGCGAGAAAYALTPPAASVVGVDEIASMLEAFAAEGQRRGVHHREVLGRWPDVAAAVEPSDVVVCHHVAYNVADLAPFLLALTASAHRRVVVELTATHPQTVMAPLWRRFWDLERPDGPTADDAVAVAREAGLDPRIERWSHPPRWHARHADPGHRADYVGWVRRRLCLPAERDGEVADALAAAPPEPAGMVTLWWPGQASGSSSGRAL